MSSTKKKKKSLFSVFKSTLQGKPRRAHSQLVKSVKDTAISPLSENATRAKFPTNQTALNVSGAEYFLESEQKTNNSKPSLSEGENEIEETPDAERDASLQKLRDALFNPEDEDVNGHWAVGAKVKAKYHSIWYNATITGKDDAQTWKVKFDGFEDLNYSVKSEDIKELPDEQPSVESANDQQETQETTVGIAPGIESKKSYPVQTANKVLKVLDSEEQVSTELSDISDEFDELDVSRSENILHDEGPMYTMAEKTDVSSSKSYSLSDFNKQIESLDSGIMAIGSQHRGVTDELYGSILHDFGSNLASLASAYQEDRDFKTNAKSNAPLPPPKFLQKITLDSSLAKVTAVDEIESGHGKAKASKAPLESTPRNAGDNADSNLQTFGAQYNWSSPILSALHPHSRAAGLSFGGLERDQEQRSYAAAMPRSDPALDVNANNRTASPAGSITLASVGSGTKDGRGNGLGRSFDSTESMTDSSSNREHVAKEAQLVSIANSQNKLPLTPSLAKFSSRFRAEQSRGKTAVESPLEVLKSQQSTDLRMSNLVSSPDDMEVLRKALQPSEKLTNRVRSSTSSHSSIQSAGMPPVNTPPPAKFEAVTPRPPSPGARNKIDRTDMEKNTAQTLPPQNSPLSSSQEETPSLHQEDRNLSERNNEPGPPDTDFLTTPKKIVVKLVLKDSVENFDVMKLKNVLAQYLSLPINQVEVLSVTRGSVIVTLRLPESAARNLVHSSNSVAKLLPSIRSIAIDEQYDVHSDAKPPEASPAAARAFAAALEMQQRTEEEASMLKAELSSTQSKQNIMMELENLRRQQLQQELEMKYASRDNQAQLAFSTAVELQHNTAEEADALKEELEQTTLSNQSQLDALAYEEDAKRRLLRQELELQSSDRENNVMKAFATALEMQQTTEEKANALESELERTTRSNQQEMDALMEQERSKREKLRQEIQLQSLDRDEQVQRAFATAMEMQQKSADEAADLKAQLAWTARKRHEDMETLAKQEKLKRENLRRQLEFEFSNRDERVEREFAESVEMQRKAQEEANALKVELTETQRKSQQDMEALVKQETLKREELREELELKSSQHDEEVQRAFVKALEMQQKSEDEAEALKAELARKTRANQQKLDALTEQEQSKREDLRQTLELKSCDRDEQMQRAFATALEMQQKSAEEAAALKADLARIERKRQEDINMLAEQEQWKRDSLRQELELKSSDQNEKVQREFAAALEVQRKAEEEATALKTELEWATSNNEHRMHALTQTENLKREDLRQTLELESSKREEKVQKAFATALEMQQQAAEEVTALKSQLKRTERERQQDIDAVVNQEKLKREELRRELEIKSSEHEKQVQRAFAAALEMQQKSAEEAEALKAELARTKRNNQEEMIALAEKEKWQRETLQHTLELKSSGDNAEVQRAFATALEMQHKSAEEAAALKAELAQTTRKSQEDINALAEQEKMKRENIRKELESKSAEREEKMKVEFATAVKLQQKAQEEARALKEELARTTLDGQRAIDALTTQENLRRENLLEKMEIKSSNRDDRVQRAFAAALEMQRKSEEEALALKSELGRTAQSNEEEIKKLLEQERLKQENLRKELDLRSSQREKQMQQTLSTALEMQKKSVEEAAALNDELARIKQTNKEQMHALKEQENMKRAKLIQALESKSSDHQQELERAFAKAVEMQQKAEEKALALTTELTQTERKNQDEIKALTEQENLKRMHLQQQIEDKSAGNEEKVQRAFAAALEMQQKSAEEASNCRAELERTMRQNKEEMNVLAQQEAMKHERLRNELELKSAERESKMHEAFVNAVEVQETTEAKASALKDELATITRSNHLEIDALMEQIQRSKQLERDLSVKSENVENALAAAVKLQQDQKLEAASLRHELAESYTASEARLQEIKQEENLRRKQLREDLESKSAQHEENVKQAFNTALAMQQKAEEEANALKKKLEQNATSSREEIAQLTNQMNQSKQLAHEQAGHSEYLERAFATTVQLQQEHEQAAQLLRQELEETRAVSAAKLKQLLEEASQEREQLLTAVESKSQQLLEEQTQSKAQQTMAEQTITKMKREISKLTQNHEQHLHATVTDLEQVAAKTAKEAEDLARRALADASAAHQQESLEASELREQLEALKTTSMEQLREVMAQKEELRSRMEMNQQQMESEQQRAFAVAVSLTQEREAEASELRTTLKQTTTRVNSIRSDLEKQLQVHQEQQKQLNAVNHSLKLKIAEAQDAQRNLDELREMLATAEKEHATAQQMQNEESARNQQQFRQELSEARATAAHKSALEAQNFRAKLKEAQMRNVASMQKLEKDFALNRHAALEQLGQRLKSEHAERINKLEQTLRSEQNTVVAKVEAQRDKLRSNMSEIQAELQSIVQDRNSAEAEVARVLQEQIEAKQKSESLSQTVLAFQEKLQASTVERTRLITQLQNTKQSAREAHQKTQELLEKEQAIEQVALLEGQQLAALKTKMKETLEQSSALVENTVKEKEAFYKEKLEAATLETETATEKIQILEQNLQDLSLKRDQMKENNHVLDAEIREATVASKANDKMVQEREERMRMELDKVCTFLDSETAELKTMRQKLEEEKERAQNLQSSLGKSEMLLVREMTEQEDARRRDASKLNARVNSLAVERRALQAALDRAESKVAMAAERSRLAEDELEQIRHQQSLDATALRLDAQSESLVQLQDQRASMLQEQTILVERIKRQQDIDSKHMLAQELQQERVKNLSKWRQQQASYEAQLQNCEDSTARLRQEHQEIINRLEATNADSAAKNVQLELEMTNLKGEFAKKQQALAFAESKVDEIERSARSAAEEAVRHQHVLLSEKQRIQEELRVQAVSHAANLQESEMRAKMELQKMDQRARETLQRSTMEHQRQLERSVSESVAQKEKLLQQQLSNYEHEAREKIVSLQSTNKLLIQEERAALSQKEQQHAMHTQQLRANFLQEQHERIAAVQDEHQRALDKARSLQQHEIKQMQQDHQVEAKNAASAREQEQHDRRQESALWQTKLERANSELSKLQQNHAAHMRTAESAQTMLFGEMKDRETRFKEQMELTAQQAQRKQLAQSEEAQLRDKNLQRLITQIQRDKATMSQRFRLATRQRDVTATKLEETTKVLHRSQMMNQHLKTEYLTSVDLERRVSAELQMLKVNTSSRQTIYTTQLKAATDQQKMESRKFQSALDSCRERLREAEQLLTQEKKQVKEQQRLCQKQKREFEHLQRRHEAESKAQELRALTTQEEATLRFELKQQEATAMLVESHQQSLLQKLSEQEALHEKNDEKIRRAHQEQASQLSSANRRLQDKLQTETRQLQEAQRHMQETRAEHAKILKEQRENAAAQIERVTKNTQARCEDQLEKLGLNYKLEFQKQEQKFLIRTHKDLDEARVQHEKEREEAVSQLKLTLEAQVSKRLRDQEQKLADKFSQRNLESEKALHARMKAEQAQQQRHMMESALKERQHLESKLILESESQLQALQRETSEWKLQHEKAHEAAASAIQDELEKAKAEQSAAELVAHRLRESESVLKQQNEANAKQHRSELETCKKLSKADFDAKLVVLQQQCVAVENARKEDQKRYAQHMADANGLHEEVSAADKRAALLQQAETQTKAEETVARMKERFQNEILSLKHQHSSAERDIKKAFEAQLAEEKQNAADREMTAMIAMQNRISQLAAEMHHVEEVSQHQTARTRSRHDQKLGALRASLQTEVRLAEQRSSQLQAQLETATALSMQKEKTHVQELNQARQDAEETRQRLRGWQIDQEQAMAALKATHARKVEELTRLIAFAANSNDHNAPSHVNAGTQHLQKPPRSDPLGTIDEDSGKRGRRSRERSKHRSTKGSSSSTFSRELNHRHAGKSRGRERERGRARRLTSTRAGDDDNNSTSRDILVKDMRSRERGMRTVISEKGKLIENPDFEEGMVEHRSSDDKPPLPVLEPPLSPQWRSSVLHDVAVNESHSNFLRSVAANLAADHESRRR